MSDCIEYHRLRIVRGQLRAAQVTRNGVKKAAYVWAWEDANGRQRAPGMVIRHLCGNPACVNPEHLVEGTYKENYADRHRLGETHLRGTGVNTNKLSEDQVREIRERYAAGGVLYRELAAEYGVTIANITNITLRRTWKWLT